MSYVPEGCVEVPCVECGVPVTVYPPEDGEAGCAVCGRCAGTPLAVAYRTVALAEIARRTRKPRRRRSPTTSSERLAP